MTVDDDQLMMLWKIYKMYWQTQRWAEEYDNLSQSEKEEREIIVAYHICLSEALEGHQFFITTKRFVGLAHLVAKDGDVGRLD